MDCVEVMVKAWNDRVHMYMREELPLRLAENGVIVKDGKIALNDWFKAQEIINNSGLHEMGLSLMEIMRSDGYDVKMNMQDSTLVYYKH